MWKQPGVRLEDEERQVLVMDKTGYFVEPPHYDGWQPIPRNKAIKRGDKIARPCCPNQKRTPIDGITTYAWVGKALNQITRDDYYFVYRPISGFRLPGNKYFAKPLPLP